MKKIKTLLMMLIAVLALSFTANAAATPEELKANLTAAGVKKASIDEYNKVFTQKDTAEVEKILNNAIKLDGKNYYAKEDLAALYLAQQNGKEKDAIKLLEEAKAIDSKNTVPYVNLLQGYGSLNDVQNYVNTMNQLMNNIPDFPLGYRAGAVFLVQNNRRSEAVPYIEKSIETLRTVSNTKYSELLPTRDVLLLDSYVLEILNYIELGETQRAVDKFITNRSIIKSMNSEVEKEVLEKVKVANEKLKTTDRKTYNDNLKKLK